jgi:hypothetical protein
MTCPSCGFFLEASHLLICPRCGQSLADTTDEEAGRTGLASDALFESPPLVFSESLPSDAGSFSEYAGAGFLSQDTPPGPPVTSPADGSAPLAPLPTPPRKRRGGLIIGILLVLVVVLAGGLGVSLYALNTRPHQAQTSATPTPTSIILFQDPLTSNANGWHNDANRSHCFFADNSYHIKNGTVCYAPTGQFEDMTISVQARQVAGSLQYPYGIAFRLTPSTSSWYEFDIASAGGWVFLEYIDGAVSFLSPFTTAAAIKTGLNTTNTLQVQAKGTHFTFFVNGIKVGEAVNTMYTSGYCGLSAGGPDTEVAYTQFQISAVS